MLPCHRLLLRSRTAKAKFFPHFILNVFKLSAKSNFGKEEVLEVFGKPLNTLIVQSSLLSDPFFLLPLRHNLPVSLQEALHLVGPFRVCCFVIIVYHGNHRIGAKDVAQGPSALVVNLVSAKIDVSNGGVVDQQFSQADVVVRHKVTS